MWSPILLMPVLVACVAAHGRVLEPPSRASAWRVGFPTPPDYDDDGANCGGFAMQHSTNGGKCGICGDAYNIAPPRPHELGGTYGLGVIVARYQPGAYITTTVDLTTSHRGFWQFKLCPDPESNDQACFDKHVLATESGETKYYPTQGSTKYNVTYKLPSGLICDHCVLQWRYTAGNNWGICANGSSGLGCGVQEQFGACSDISVGMSKSMLRDGVQSADIPPPLMSYLKNGYFDAQQGVLHLLRGTTQLNSIGPSNSLQHSQQSQSRGQPPPNTVQQRPTQLNQQRKQNQHQTQKIHPNQIASQNSRPIQTNQKIAQNSQQKQAKSNYLNQNNQITSQYSRPSQTNQKLVQNHQHSIQTNGPTHSVPNQKLQSQKLIQHPSIQEAKYNYSSYQQQTKQKEQKPSVQQQSPLISKLDSLIQKHRDGLSQPQRPFHSHSIDKPLTQTVQITHTVQTFTRVPLNPHQGTPGNPKPWKTGKNARYKNKKKHKSKGKQKKRKKKIPYEEYNRIIKIGTW